MILLFDRRNVKLAQNQCLASLNRFYSNSRGLTGGATNGYRLRVRKATVRCHDNCASSGR